MTLRRSAGLVLFAILSIALLNFAAGQPFQFAVELDGKLWQEVDAVEIDDVDLEPILMGPTRDAPAVVVCPGTAVYGNVAIRTDKGSEFSTILFNWWTDCSQGKNIRKDISVVLMESDAEIRRFNLMDTFPLSWAGAEFSGATAVDTLVCSVGRLELGISDVKGSYPSGSHTVLITGGGQADVADPSWAKKGGAVQVVAVNKDPCSDSDKTAGSEVSEVLLEAPLSSGRQALCEWITAACLPDELDPELAKLDVQIEAKEELLAKRRKERQALLEERKKRSLRLRANLGGDASTYAYQDCIPTRYRFPLFSSSDPALLEERFTFKPHRLELA